ncbi:MAG: hypothetical protein Q8P11_00850 [bacterium]|nr:hypothetical protein [bacterium]
MPDDIFTPQPKHMGDPAQMSTPPTPSAQPPMPSEPVQDIFSDTEPLKSSPNVTESTPASGKTYNPYSAPLTQGGMNKKIVIMIVAGVLVIVAIVLVIWLVMSMTGNSSTPNEVSQPSSEQTPVNQPVQPVYDSSTNPTDEQAMPYDSQDNSATDETTQPAVIDPATVDQDEDGVTDEQEALNGTNPYLPDTDNDMLSDRQELEIYHTDPLNADTDGDGYLDGSEVQNGYDPKGTGRLLVLPTN